MLLGKLTLTSTFNCVKGINDGLVLSVGVLKEKKKVWSTLELFSPFKSHPEGMKKKWYFTSVLLGSRFLGTLGLH